MKRLIILLFLTNIVFGEMKIARSFKESLAPAAFMSSFIFLIAYEALKSEKEIEKRKYEESLQYRTEYTDLMKNSPGDKAGARMEIENTRSTRLAAIESEIKFFRYTFIPLSIMALFYGSYSWISTHKKL